VQIVTRFLLKTCRIRHGLNLCALDALKHGVLLATSRRSFNDKCGGSGGGDDDDDDENILIPMTTGSVAEFYIEPMLPCIGDVDIMCHHRYDLAIPAGTAPPTQLPDEFHSRVKVFEIVDDMEFPCYVYLVWSYLLTACSAHCGKYNALQLCKPVLIEYETDEKSHGPAHAMQFAGSLKPAFGRSTELFSEDIVFCLRCLSWPVGRHKPRIGQHDAGTTAGHTQQLLIVLSAMDVMWFVQYIVGVDKMNGSVKCSAECRSPEQKLY